MPTKKKTAATTKTATRDHTYRCHACGAEVVLAQPDVQPGVFQIPRLYCDNSGGHAPLQMEWQRPGAGV